MGGKVAGCYGLTRLNKLRRVALKSTFHEPHSLALPGKKSERAMSGTGSKSVLEISGFRAGSHSLLITQLGLNCIFNPLQNLIL
jgi:hypothetical protein